MDRESAVREIARLTGDAARQSRRSEHIWSANGEEAALVMLLMKGDSLPSEIAEAGGVTTARVAAMLKQMESKGLVTREADPRDRRCVRVHLTEAGSQRARSMVTCVLNTWGRLVDYLGMEDTESLLRIMEKIIEFMKTDERRCCAGSVGEDAPDEPSSEA